MIILKATTETLALSTSSTADIDYSVSYADITTTTFAPSSSEGKITTATSTTILSAPAASTQRQIKLITIANRHASTSNAVRIKKDISGTEYYLTPLVTLLAGEMMQYTDKTGWVFYLATGYAKQSSQTAAGSTTEIQFNNGGVLASDPDFTWDSSGNKLGLNGADTGIVIKGVTNEPSAPGVGNVNMYAKGAVNGNGIQLKTKGPSGLDTSLQAAIWQNPVVTWTPGGAAGVFTGTAGSIALGTSAAVQPTTTNLYTAMRRSTWANVATTLDQQVGPRTDNLFGRGNAAGIGGFLFVCRFGITTWTAGDRLFVGLSTGGSAVVTVQTSTLTNTLGFCIEAGDTAITFLHNDGSGTGTKETISGQPALASNQGYDAYIWCASNASTVHYRLDDILTGATIVEGVVSTELPSVTVLMCAQCIMSNGANTAAGAATVGLNRMYIETDR